MINQQLLDYIKQQLQQNVSREQIKNSLVTNGWEAADVEEGFSAIVPRAIPIPPAQPVSSVSPIIPNTQPVSNFINPVVNQQSFTDQKKPKRGLMFVFILLLIIVLSGLGWFGFKYFNNSKMNNQTEIPLANEETNQTPAQTPPVQTTEQNDSILADCGTINWDTSLKALPNSGKQLSSSEKAALACSDKSLLNCSPVILKVNNQDIPPTSFFENNNYKILGLESNFCKISAEVVNMKTQKVTVGTCKMPMSDLSKIPQGITNFGLSAFLNVSSSVIQGKSEQKNWECNFNQL